MSSDSSTPGHELLPISMFMDLKRSGPVPLYLQIAERIERAIRDQTLERGGRLEKELSLAARLGLARPTVRRAIQELVDKGLVVRRRGVGTQIVAGQVTRAVALTSLYEDLADSGRCPGTRVVLREVTAAGPDARAALDLPAGSAVLHIRRVRTAEGVPVALLENFLPSDKANPSIEDLQTHGLYQLLRAKGITIQVATQRISARIATNDEADWMDVPHRSALLVMERTAYDNSGRAIELGRHAYRPDMYSFESTVVR